MSLNQVFLVGMNPNDRRTDILGVIKMWIYDVYEDFDYIKDDVVDQVSETFEEYEPEILMIPPVIGILF